MEAKEKETEETGDICDKCGSPMVVKRGRFGKFVACSNFPECKNILKDKKEKTEPDNVGRECPKCSSPLIYREGRFGKFVACSNFPECRHTEKIKKDGDKGEKEANNGSSSSPDEGKEKDSPTDAEKSDKAEA
jgi:DNA topoisomerase-1